tara:strand:+ start:163 stop:483 length:321 start_codon:yes stop_codon:yes gene_type:complete
MSQNQPKQREEKPEGTRNTELQKSDTQEILDLQSATTLAVMCQETVLQKTLKRFNNFAKAENLRLPRTKKAFADEANLPEAPPQRSVNLLLDWNRVHTGGEKMEET